MFIQNSSKIRTLFSKISSTDSFKVNQGAIYIAASRGMGTGEIGSGAGKGGGSGGRLVEPENKTKASFFNFIKSAFKLSLDSEPGTKHPSNDTYILSTQSSVREAGGSMGRKGAAQEDMYFAKESKDMRDKLKQHLKEEVKKHEAAIKEKKELMKELEKDKSI